MMEVSTDPQRSAIMRAVKQKHTGPEMIVRRLLFSLGLRYRLHLKNLPGARTWSSRRGRSRSSFSWMLLASTRGLRADHHAES